VDDFAQNEVNKGTVIEGKSWAGHRGVYPASPLPDLREILLPIMIIINTRLKMSSHGSGEALSDLNEVISIYHIWGEARKISCFYPTDCDSGGLHSTTLSVPSFNTLLILNISMHEIV
jgi:hypothetical protein